MLRDTVYKRITSYLDLPDDSSTQYIKEKLSEHFQQNTNISDELENLKLEFDKLQKQVVTKKNNKPKIVGLIICMLGIVFAEALKFYELFTDLEYFDQDWKMIYYSGLMSLIIFSITFFVAKREVKPNGKEKLDLKEQSALWSSSLLLLASDFLALKGEVGSLKFYVSLATGVVLSFFIPRAFSWGVRKLKELWS